MPHINLTITKAWRYGHEGNRIHFTIPTVDGGVRHCHVAKGDALYDVLNNWLQAKGYVGPKSEVA